MTREAGHCKDCREVMVTMRILERLCLPEPVTQAGLVPMHPDTQPCRWPLLTF